MREKCMMNSGINKCMNYKLCDLTVTICCHEMHRQFRENNEVTSALGIEQQQHILRQLQTVLLFDYYKQPSVALYHLEIDIETPHEHYNRNMKLHLSLILPLFAPCISGWELPEFMKEYAATEKIVQQQRQQLSMQSVTLSDSSNGRSLSETDSPTESPAPSPSPSWQPTVTPTETASPTLPITPEPTESPAPSPSPSWNPTLEPTDRPSVSPTDEPTMSPSQLPSLEPTITPMPTNMPSAAPSDSPSEVPSARPTMMPSISLQPSSQPSESPSSKPTGAPTISAAPSSEPSEMPSPAPSDVPTMLPSSVPSGAPTISEQPSNMPTVVEFQEASYKVMLPFETLLNATQVAAFEQGTAEWLEKNGVSSGTTTDVKVSVTSQVVVVTNLPARRELQTVSVPSFSRKDLEVSFDITATYAGTDTTFDLRTELEPEFEIKNTLWVRELVNQDTVFIQLDPVAVSIQEMDNERKRTKTSDGMGAASAAIISVVAIGAALLGIAASVYSIRSYRTSVYGQELHSPTGSQDNSFFGDQGVAVDLNMTRTFDAGVAYGDNRDKKFGLEPEEDQSCMSMPRVLSPSTLEKGCNPVKPILDGLVFRQAESNTNSMDPPSAASEIGAPSRSEPKPRVEISLSGKQVPKKETIDNIPQMQHRLDPGVDEDEARAHYRRKAIFDEVRFFFACF